MERKVRAVTVDGLVARDGEILLVKRRKGPYEGYWAIPGGYLELGETCEEGTIREVREETGLVTRVEKLLGVYSAPGRHPDQSITVAYVLRIEGGQVEKSDEATDIGWFSLEKTPKLAFDHGEIVKDYLKEVRK